MPRRKQLAPLEQDSGGAMIERRGLLHGLRAGRRLRMIPQILALVAVLSIGALPHPYPRSVPALALPATRGVCASPGSACTPAGSRHADAARAGDGLLVAHPPPPAHGPPPACTCKRARSRAGAQSQKMLQVWAGWTSSVSPFLRCTPQVPWCGVSLRLISRTEAGARALTCAA
jgi:hypothetical protein